jgi:glycosyltransferase involved in cell wall biosynthesis
MRNKFSVIINTCNRSAYLENCLQSLRQQRNSEFEVIVVNGPSTDNTWEICKRNSLDIKYFECPDLNLSVSRNIGIKNSSGDICAFIDDDAVAYPDWLEKLEQKYAFPGIVGVGGYTLDRTGRSFQARAVLCDRFGSDYAVTSGLDLDTFCFPETQLYPSLLGTNSSFRRESLIQIGGFDEVFAYFLDETDVCLRLVETGGKLVYAQDALVKHGYASSHLRTTQNIPRSRYYSQRSKVYFMLKHARSSYSDNEIHERIHDFIESEKKYNDYHLKNGDIDKATHANIRLDIMRAVDDGVAKSYVSLETKPLEVANEESQFMPFTIYKDKLSIVFISRSYPPQGVQGIASWTSCIASGLAQEGHSVHIITEEAREAPSSIFSGGLWIHRIAPSSGFDSFKNIAELCNIPGGVLQWSTDAYSEIVRQGINQFDIISAPIWDLEGLVSMLMAPEKVITSLHTTYKLALPFKPDWTDRPNYLKNHINPIIAGEEYIFANGINFLANSYQILEDIGASYINDVESRSAVVPHGINDILYDPEFYMSYRPEKKILFVGRQETRKGFDTAIAAAIEICSARDNIFFTFVGSPCPEDKNSINAIASIPISLRNKQIIITGHVDDSKLHEYYKNCDIFIAPSRYESFGLIAIEAMRYGKAVIAGDRGGLREVIKNGEDGLLVDPDSVSSLTNSINKLLRENSLLQTFGKRARKKYEKYYTANTMAENVVTAYRSMLNKK